MPTSSVSGWLGRIGKVGALTGLAGLAVLALLSGSDRQSRLFPNSPSLIGWPYDTGAARAEAILAYVQTGPVSAIRHARRAIISDPLSVQAVSILGRAQLYSDDLANARQTFMVAGQLGWRDEMTQIYWLDQAIQANNFKTAAERLDALLRQSPDDVNRDKFLAVVSATPEGREALSKRLKLAPNWAHPYLTEVSSLGPSELTQRIDVLKRTGSGLWDCSSTGNIAQTLIDANRFDEAQSVWRQNCATSASLVYDGEFDHLDITHQSAAFEWQLTARGDVDIALLRSGDNGNRALSAKVNAATTLPVIRQLIVLTPGRYRLTWHLPQTSQAQARALEVSFACKADLGKAQNGAVDPVNAERRTLDVTIDFTCPARQLVFWLAPNSQIQLDRVSLQAI